MELRPDQDRCRYFEGLFSPYIAGGLDEVERHALAEHLHACEVCSQQFGISWRRATASIAKERPQPTRTRSRSRAGLWLLVVSTLVGVTVLGAMGLLDAAEGKRFDPLGRGQQRAMDEELGRMLHVQTALLEAVVEPLRGARQTVSHAARGAAQDFVERVEAIRNESKPVLEVLAKLDAEFHPLLRVTDPAPGGRSWNRMEWLEAVGREGMSPVILVEVVAAYRDVIFARITWGKRPAFAWLLPIEDAGAAGPVQRFVLAFLLFAEP
ncbi:MAG: zf-HC2 domain-containing protein [Planctomycetes bacterium]|nr:zf-HC2 domain-containing protein [Planctomycetota bacterium]